MPATWKIWCGQPSPTRSPIPNCFSPSPRTRLELAAASQEVSAEDLTALDHKIARLEKAAGEKLSKALAAGVDPKIAVAAGKDLADQIQEARAQRAKVAAWAADAADRRSRGDLLTKIAAESAEALLGEGRRHGPAAGAGRPRHPCDRYRLDHLRDLLRQG